MSTDTRMFRGWPAEALEFYERLEADNSKTYWTAHKDVYETVVLSPMKAILAELAPEFGDGKVFRLIRDVRFSTDKSPYKTHIGATIGASYRDGRVRRTIRCQVRCDRLCQPQLALVTAITCPAYLTPSVRSDGGDGTQRRLCPTSMR